MRRYNAIDELEATDRGRAIAIGAFDGVHLGHQAIIRSAVELARARGLVSMALTFEPNPLAVLRPELKPTVLTTVAHKAALIERLGVDELLVVPFTPAFARIRADRFAELLAMAPIDGRAVVVGQSFRYGHRGAGTAERLRLVGRSIGLDVVVPEVVASPDDKPISSTRIRRLVAEGRVEEAIPLLGRPHSVEGVVVKGAQRGRALGLPTANVDLPHDAALPGRGVYAGLAAVGGPAHAAAVNVGYAPTFTAGARAAPLRLEAFLLDYEGDDLYGRTIRVEFLERLRDERRFPSPEALVAQVQEDIRRTREAARAFA
jgi:riboflavin kinase/FMN adenylyltransferase